MTPATAPVTSRHWVFWAFLGLAAFYLVVEHRTHLAGLFDWLPLGFLLLCPLMHAFGHTGHGGHGAHRNDAGMDRARETDAPPVDMAGGADHSTDAQPKDR